MSDETKRSRAWIWWCAALLLLLLSYPLSIGPAFRWTKGMDTLERVYAPLIWLAARSEYLGNALDWYMALWMQEGA